MLGLEGSVISEYTELSTGSVNNYLLVIGFIGLAYLNRITIQ